MPVCLVCDSEFFHQTQDDTAVGCDCNECVDPLETLESDFKQSDIDVRRAAWHRKIEDAMKPEGADNIMEDIDYEGAD